MLVMEKMCNFTLGKTIRIKAIAVMDFMVQDLPKSSVSMMSWSLWAVSFIYYANCCNRQGINDKE